MLLEKQLPFDTNDLRSAFGNFATGVTVTTAIDDSGNPRGFTANSFTSVSLDPPLVLVCLAKTAFSFSLFNEISSFAINILSEEQHWIANQFASANSDKYDQVNWRKSAIGNPLLDNVVCWLDCQRHDVIDAGDHIILIGLVTDYAYESASPLGYCQGGYVSFSLASKALGSADAPNVVYGAIVEHDNAILLMRSNGKFILPTAPSLGSQNERGTLLGNMADAGIAAELPFLFEIYDNKHDSNQNVYYRGHAKTVSDAARSSFVQMDDIPFDMINDTAMRSMLQRFVKERQQDEFGLYVDDSVSGNVEPT